MNLNHRLKNIAIDHPSMTILQNKKLLDITHSSPGGSWLYWLVFFTQVNARNYWSTYVQKTKIALKTLKAYTSSIPSNLRGGIHGHLELVISSSEFNNFTGENYIKTSHPGPLQIPPGTQIHGHLHLWKDHQNELNLFCETVALKSTLKYQIIGTIDPLYMKEFKNSFTETIMNSILQIFQYLFKWYGCVDYSQLKTKEDKLKISNTTLVTLQCLSTMH